MTKRLLMAALLLLTPVYLYADGGCTHDVAMRVQSGSLQAISGARAKVYEYTISISALTPLATIYTDATLGTTTPNPVIADTKGNYHFCAVPGQYTVVVTNPNDNQSYTLQQVTVPIALSGTISAVSVTSTAFAGTSLAVTSGTFSTLNNIRFAAQFATIQAAIDDLVAANVRGGLVIDDRIGSASIAGFTIKPGVTVVLGAANYGFTSPIIMQPEGCHLIGQGSGNNGGTTIHHSGAIGDLIHSYNTSGGTYWHDCTIENLRIDMSAGGNAAANAIRIWNFGQSSSIRNVQILSAPASGIKLDGLPVPVSLENVSVFTNGAYGVDVDFGNDGDSAGNSVAFWNVGGDNNVSGLFRFKNGNDRSVVNLYNTKSERITSTTVNNPVITLESFSGILNVFGGHFYSLTGLNAGTPVGDVVKITTAGTPAVNISGASQRLYAQVVNDVVNSRTFGIQGNYIPQFSYANGRAKFEEYGSSATHYYASGSQNLLGFRQFGDSSDRGYIKGTGAFGALSLDVGTSSAVITSAGKGTFNAGLDTGTLATGTRPLITLSTTLNTNLNADLVDGLHAAAFPLMGVAPTVNRAVCWKTATTLGYCSTVVDASGACTCN